MRPQSQAGRLYVVATPIGNLGDITIRALKVLSEVDLIACEDTRRTGHLLSAHGIRKPTISYFEHNEERRATELLERLREGASIAIVTDAGTPAISDPGYRLVNAALDAGIAVVAIPGPSAVAAAISIAGLPSNRFTFEGFVPARASARTKLLNSLRSEPRTMVFFETAHRLGGTLDAMAESFGKDRRIAVARELTKLFEETIRGMLHEVAQHFAAKRAKGEITLIVEGAPESDSESHDAADLTVEMLTSAGLGLKQASEVIAKLTGRSRREIYQQSLGARGSGRQSK